MRIFLIYFIFIILSALPFCNVMVAMMNRSYPRCFRETRLARLKTDTRVRCVCCMYVRVRAYGVTCQKMTEATAQPAARLGIVISPRYEFYFLVCFSRLTISLPRGEQRFAPAAPKSEKAERYYVRCFNWTRRNFGKSPSTRRLAFFAIYFTKRSPEHDFWNRVLPD